MFLDEVCKERNSKIYDEVEFHHAVLNASVGYDLLQRPRRNSWDGLRILDKFSALSFEQEIGAINFPRPRWPRPLGHGRRMTGWPERQFMLRCANGGGHSGYVSGPFMAEKGEVVVQLETFLAQALDAPLSDYWMSNPGVLGILPDYRVAISGIRLERGKIQVDLKWARKKTPVAIQIVVIQGKIETHLEASESGAGFVANLTRIPDRIVVVISEPQDPVPLDWADFSPLDPALDPAIQVSLGTEELQDLIAVGENEQLEFKSSATTANRDDVLETLVAFANSRGGQILVGIDNGGKPIGLSERNVGPRIANWAHEMIEPRITVQCLDADFDGKHILIVKVPEGKEKPYLTKREHRAFVRHGDTDQLATREELSSFFQKEPIRPGFL